MHLLITAYSKMAIQSLNCTRVLISSVIPTVCWGILLKLWKTSFFHSYRLGFPGSQQIRKKFRGKSNLTTHELSLFETYHQNYTEITPFSTYIPYIYGTSQSFTSNFASSSNGVLTIIHGGGTITLNEADFFTNGVLP